MSASSAPAVLPATLRLGAVHLTVADLDRSVAFYQDAIGLRPHARDGARAALGAGGEDLLVLVEQPGARRPGRHAGLYHFALLHPSRAELARAASRLAVTRTPISGASDHGVSEALYLPDPDGNGIELYADRPREAWPAPERRGDRVGVYTQALDVPGLLSAAGDEAPPRHADPGLRMGHVHLHVGDLGAALAFYRDEVGFELMAEYPGAEFLAAGGYHHHVGVNVWRGVGVGPAPDDAVGLREWTVVLDEPGALAALAARVGADVVGAEDGLLLRDPSGNAARYVVRG